MDHAAASGRTFYRGLLEALTQVMGSAKGYLFTHGPRVANLSRQLARAMDLDERQTAELILASILSDMGMIGLAEHAWENPTPVLPDEVRLRVQQHPIRSEATLLAIPHLESVAPLVRHHHEWWDGSGYPDGLSGDEIPLGAQILRLADTVSALEEPRPQRPALEPDEVERVVREGRGGEFGSHVVDAYLHLVKLGRVTGFNDRVYERSVRKAAEELLPTQVSPLSADQLLDILSSLIDAKDPYTAGHSRRVAILSVAVANQLGLGDPLRATLWAAGYLHDLGKVSIPLSVLAKRGQLDPEERTEIQSHAPRGAAILGEIDSLKHLSPGARYHHERWDGSGYPEGLRGEHIPLVARVLAVCDAYDAMTSNRAYRPPCSHEEAIEEIALSTGRQFGPRVSACFLSLPDQLFEAVRQPRSERPEFFPPPEEHRRPSYRRPGPKEFASP